MQIRILTSDDVKAALPMPKAIEIMKHAFGQLSTGMATVPLRSKISSDKGDTLLMPAYLRGSQDLGVKIVSIYKDNPSKGIPTVTAIVIVLDPQTGRPRALIEGDSLTAIRTGATGGLASELLARRNAKTVALFGAGVQARAQLQGVIAVRSIAQVNLFDLSASAAQKLADEIAPWVDAPAVNLVSNSKEAIQDADIIITATTSSKPVFDGHGLKAGTHITGVGSYTPQMQEVDETTVQRARIVVDSRDACLAEAGDLIIPKATVDAELGEIINGIKPGRHSDEEITFFKTVGVAVEDAAAAAAILSEAEKNELGTIIEVS
jgi:ornithine cyclodeaminase/alanine dehydrogenase-like protein (mu-crystallin family)